MTGVVNRRAKVQRVHAAMELGEGRAVQILELASGMRAIVESGRAIEQTPAVRSVIDAPPEAGTKAAGERSGDDTSPVVRSTDEQDWFRNTFCTGAQACAQGWDWADCVTGSEVGSGTGIAMVGSEGTQNATLRVLVWECICVGPFCVGGHECFWVENWRGLVVPGHWISVDTRAPDHKYLRWSLEGAGGDTQVSLAAKYH